MKENNENIIDWSDKIVLVAEDADDNYFLLRAILKRTKLNLIRAKDGQEAIDIFNKEEKIDTILMDLNMPVMDGLEAVRLIRNINSEIPIIAQTAYTTTTDRLLTLKAGCNDCITKPIRQQTLIDLLHKYIN